ncbi:hypothetical protein BH10CYA1_BH10CYA1_46030 [soil metagenome]
MPSDRRIASILTGLAIATANTLIMSPVVQAQGILQLIEERRAAMEQAQPHPQNSAPQTNGAAPQHSTPPTPSLPAGDVSMVTLKTEMGPGGQQLVVTPKGVAVPLPGAGVAGQAVQVYMGSNGGYWYVDKHHHQVDLTSSIQRLKAHASAEGGRAVTPPQYAPPPQSYMQTNSHAAGAASLGAMAGAAMTSGSTWDTVPYGAPVHYGAASQPYYNQDGKQVVINNSVDNVNAYHSSALQEQLAWYRQQQLAQGDNYQVWQQPVINPFIATGYGAEYGAAGYGAAAGVEAAHYGAVEGEDAARYGAAAGVGAAHYGAAEGQQAARYGAAAGAGAAHYGAAEGQQAARFGAAEGAGAAHYGAAEGQQAARFGAAEGAAHGAGDGRFGGAGGRFGGAGDRFGGHRR